MCAKNKNEEAIFNAAIEIDSPAERAAFVKSACGDDAELLARVEGLLKVHYEDDSFLRSPPAAIDETLATSPLTEGPGTRIDRYKLLQLIGEGGFGVVYMAEQEKPIRRRVALKIIKLGMDTKQVIARFEAERQALAMMDHPNIARVLDAGATDTGRPYFVMELVKGIPITEYCDKSNLDTRQRLELFIDVCKAVQHAHQKGIIHRDIKPSNVMITLHDGKPVPKIIDFGIAKATQQRLTEKTFFTEFQQFIGTPEYMSPEQAEMSGLDVDTRSDIYSLGVLLYEQLTGTTPFAHEQLLSVSYDQMRKLISEADPPKPSTRLSTLGDVLTDIAKHRNVQPAQLCKIVRGDLDWIVMKALEKDRTRRYETANEFAMDIGRHLGDKPVIASPPSTIYRVRKFTRRHQTGVAAGLSLATSLVIGFSLAVTGFVQASHQRDVAETQRQRAGMNFQMAREAVDEMTRLAEEQLADVPEMKQIQQQLLQKAQIFYADFVEENRNDTAVLQEVGQAYTHVGNIHRTLGQHAQAENAYELAIEIFEEMIAEHPTVSSYREGLAHAYGGLAEVLRITGRLEESEEPKQQQKRLWTELVTEFPTQSQYRVNLAYSRLELQALLTTTGRLEEAEQVITQAIDFLEKCIAEYPDTKDEMYALSECYRDLGHVLNEGERRQEATEVHQRAVKLRRKLTAEFPKDPTNEFELARSLIDLGIFLSHTASHFDESQIAGSLDEAEELIREAADLLNNLVVEASELPAKQRQLGQTYHHLGEVLHRAGRQKEAEKALRQAFTIQQEVANAYPDVPDDRAAAKNDLEWLGLLLLDTGRLNESEQILRQALDWGEKLAGQFPRNMRYRRELVGIYHRLGRVLTKAGKPSEAAEFFRKSIKACQDFQVDFPEAICIQVQLFHTYREMAVMMNNTGETTEAENAYWQAQSIMENLVADLPGEPELQNWLGDNCNLLVSVMSKKGEYEQAEDFSHKAVDIYEQLVTDCPNMPAYQNALAYSHTLLGNVLRDTGRLQEAEQAREEALSICAKAIELDPNNSGHWYTRANIYASTQRWSQAVTDFSKAIELDPNNSYMLYRRALAHLGNGDTEGYRERCADMLERFSQTEDFYKAHWVAWTCALAADTVGDWSEPLRLAEMAAAESLGALYQHSPGKVLYRAGRFDEAVQRLSKMASEWEDGKEFPVLTSPAYTWFYLAMAHHQLGNTDQSQWYFKMALERAEKEITGDAEWNRKLTLQLLQAEAAGLLGVSEKAVQKGKQGTSNNE